GQERPARVDEDASLAEIVALDLEAVVNEHLFLVRNALVLAQFFFPLTHYELI
ncbi:MAG: hypothetical protein GTO55_00285, partial [Armatimonadetes bacterium]|nr:hypothetical protein [Armatimonadota bacterium]NIT30120.1 hypothetical protein [Armatimonadota bacterium]